MTLKGGRPLISLNYRDARPIYEQLKERLRRLILSGALCEGERLPSVRELAAELAINPNTIMRAYRELETEGFVYSVQGKGTFAGRLSEVDVTRKQLLLRKFRDSAKELLQLGVRTEELSQILQQEANTHD